MNEALLIWGYLAVGNLIQFSTITAIIALIVYVIFMLPTAMMSSFGTEESEIYKGEVAAFKMGLSWFKPIAITTLTVLSLYSLYPDKEDLKWIIGGSLVWNGVEAASDIEGIEQLPKNTVDAMNHFLESIQEEETE